MQRRASQTMKAPERPSPGRTYRKGFLGTFFLLHHIRGSALLNTLPWAVLGAAYTAALHTQVSCNVWPTFCSNGHPQFEREDRPFLFVHTYSYQVILLASGFGLVFRLNQSLARYWEARTAAQNMAAKWCDVALMGLTFDEEEAPADAERKQCVAFSRCLVHLVSLLHAVALHSLRGDDPALATLQPHACEPAGAPRARGCCADINADYDATARGAISLLGGLAEEERRGLLASTEPVHVVLGWLTRLIVRRRRKGGLGVDAPIVSRLHQFLSDGNLWFLGALKVADTPFPFAYAQLNAAICFANLALFPVVIADKVANLPLACAISFCAIAFLFGLNEVARDLEDPFETEFGLCGANALHAPRLQRLFDARLAGIQSSSPAAAEGWAGARQMSWYGPFLAEALGEPAAEGAVAAGGGAREGGGRHVAREEYERRAEAVVERV